MAPPDLLEQFNSSRRWRSVAVGQTLPQDKVSG